MSRHEYTPPGWPPHYTFVTGWDDPLGSYFGLVIDASIGQAEDGVIAAAGGVPPHFQDIDNMMRVVNGRIRGRLPPVQLPSELRRELRRDANSKRPVVNSISVSDPGERAAAPAPFVRPCMALGTCKGYMDADELQGVMDGMAGQYVSLERLYWARKAEGLTEDNDADTKLIRQSLGIMGGVCQILDGMVHTDALVAIAALQPFYGFSAEAARILHAESANANSHSETVH